MLCCEFIELSHCASLIIRFSHTSHMFTQSQQPKLWFHRRHSNKTCAPIDASFSLEKKEIQCDECEHDAMRQIGSGKKLRGICVCVCCVPSQPRNMSAFDMPLNSNFYFFTPRHQAPSITSHSHIYRYNIKIEGDAKLNWHKQTIHILAYYYKYKC